jgi:molybdenum cofactor synthesis domain-containing protein
MTPKASILIIGNEILSGRTQDKNLHWLAGELSGMGIKVAEAAVVPDIEAEIIATLNRHRAKYDYVFTSGGIGPTHDDITSATIAKAFGVELPRNEEAAQLLYAYYGTTDLSEARLKMAEIPAGAELILNPVSGAPGFKMENVYVMAGVPSIFKAMFNGLRHTLIGGDPILSSSTTTFIAESMVAKELGDLQNEYQQLDLGSYPFARDGNVGTRLVISGTDTAALQAAQTKLHAMLDNKRATYQLDTSPSE